MTSGNGLRSAAHQSSDSHLPEGFAVVDPNTIQTHAYTSERCADTFPYNAYWLSHPMSRNPRSEGIYPNLSMEALLM
jgi:hypothetical protein